MIRTIGAMVANREREKMMKEMMDDEMMVR